MKAMTIQPQKSNTEVLITHLCTHNPHHSPATYPFHFYYVALKLANQNQSCTFL